MDWNEECRIVHRADIAELGLRLQLNLARGGARLGHRLTTPIRREQIRFKAKVTGFGVPCLCTVQRQRADWMISGESLADNDQRFGTIR